MPIASSPLTSSHSRRSLHHKLLVCASLTALALTSSAAASASPGKLTLGNWNRPEQHAVLGAGVMSNVGDAGFDGAASLSGPQLADALSALGALGALGAPEQPAGDGAQPGINAAHVAALRTAAEPITVVRFDAQLVDELGLGDVAEHVQQATESAGLAPPSYFGSEVVARYLNLRYMQPHADAALEPYPTGPITRAEAAHSFAVVLGFSGWEVAQAREQLSTYALPHYDAAQRQVLTLAVSKIGMPYVWGGTTDDTSDGLSHGGYDCSGFAWRVYKVSGFSWGREIGGRTAAQQAGEIPRSQRIRLPDVSGGDLLFFGSAHFNSKTTATNVDHEGIALSSQWAINSSGQGVAVEPLTTGWLHDSFTWARRVL